MEEKLLEILKLANQLNEKQERVYAQISYSANKDKKLEIIIISKNDYSYVERCSVMLFNRPISKLNVIIKLLKEYVGGIY